MPSIADVFVTLVPETSKIADGLQRAFREADSTVTEAARRWGEEIQKGIGKVKVDVTADTAKAEAEIDAVGRDRKATIEVDADTLGSEVQRAVSGGMSSGGEAGLSAMTPALMGAGITMGAGIASSLSGLAGLLPAGLLGAGGIVGTLATGLDGVKDAWDATGKAASASGKDQAAATEKANEAMSKLAPNARLFVQALAGIKPVWDGLQATVQNSLFANIGPQVQQLATRYLPLLQSVMGGMAGTMNQAFGQLAQFFSKPETMTAVQGIFANIGNSFQVWSRALSPFVDGFLRFTQVGSSFLPQLAGMVNQAAGAFDQFAKSGDLRQWMQTAMSALQQLGAILPTVGRIFMNLAPIGNASLGFIKTLLDGLAPAVKPLAGAITGLINNGLTPMASLLGKLTNTAMPGFVKNVETLSKDLGYLVDLFGILDKIGLPKVFVKVGEWLDHFAQPLRLLADTGDALTNLFGGHAGGATESVTDKAQEEINRQRLAKGLPPVQLPGGPTLSASPGTLSNSGRVAMPNMSSTPTLGTLSTRGTVADPVYTMPAAASPSTSAAPGDAALLAGVPAGSYSKPGSNAWDLTKGLGDCSSAVEDLVNMLQGNSTAGRGMSTGNAPEWLAAHGFVPNTTGANVPGAFNVGFNDHHMQATLPGGTNFNWGSNAAAARGGVGGTGAFDPAFTQHYYLPGGAAGSMPGMPNAGGSSAPTGGANDPYFMKYPDGYQPPGPDMSQLGQQMGGDIWSSILPDGFKNPTQFGGMKFLTGLMGGLLGMPMGGSASGAGKGQPASYGSGGGGGGGLLSGLTGLLSQPFGALQVGSPGSAPGEFMPGMPTPADASASPFGVVGQPGTAGPGNNGQVVDNSINVNNPVGQDHFNNMVATAQQAQVPRVRQGVRPLP